MARNSVVATTPTPPPTTGKNVDFDLENIDFAREVTRFSRPHLVTGFRERRNPVTRCGNLGHFKAKTRITRKRQILLYRDAIKYCEAPKSVKYCYTVTLSEVPKKVLTILKP